LVAACRAATSLAFPLYGALFLALTVVFIYRRKRQLQGITFHLSGPEVPVVILDTVRDAESRFYRELGFCRRCVEDLQDVLSFVAPELVYRLNLSVGPYRIKARSVADLIDEALPTGYLTFEAPPGQTLDALLAYFSMQPVINQWQAALLLQHLKNQHPVLVTLPWSAIAADRRLIAKLYSGYMGAGGDGAAWRSSAEPGKVARARMQLGWGRRGEGRLYRRDAETQRRAERDGRDKDLTTERTEPTGGDERNG